jgi:hypothetical protein
MRQRLASTLAVRRASTLAVLVPVALLLLALLLASSTVLAAWPRSGGAIAAATTPTVTFAPSPVEIGLGTIRNVDIVVENVTGLYAVELRVAFPNGLAQVVDANPSLPGVQIRDGNIFAGYDTYPIQNTANNSTGRIEYILSVTGSETGMTGSGIIASIPLQGLHLGNAAMSFVEVILAERDGTRISAVMNGGQVSLDVVTRTSAPTATSPGLGTPTLTATVTPTGGAPGATSTPTRTATPTILGPTQVRVVPDNLVLGVGMTGTVQIQVANVQDLYGYDLRVDYNGTRLDVENASPPGPPVRVHMGNVFDGFSFQVVENTVSDDGLFGQIRLVVHIDSGVPNGFTGSGLLCWFDFRGMAVGLSNVTLADVQLVDHNGLSINRYLYHGQANVVSGGVTPQPSPTLTATPTGVLPTPTTTPTLTVTPTGPIPSATNSLTPTVTRTGVPPLPTCRERLVNGGFETLVSNEAPPWVRSGFPTYTTDEYHTGTRSAWLGGYFNARDRLYQEFSVPVLAAPDYLERATLVYWWAMVTQEPTHAFDFMYVRIRNSSGALLDELQVLSDGSAAGIWTRSAFALHTRPWWASYQGQTVRVSFEADTDAANATSFFVDDVSVEMCEIRWPTPTSTATNTPTATAPPTSTPTVTPTPLVEVFVYTAGTYTNMYDSYLNAWDPATVFGHQGALTIRTGGVKRPLLYFDVSRIPGGVTVVDARLRLYAGYRDRANSMSVDVYGLKKNWVEAQATWQRAATGTLWQVAGADDPSLDHDDLPASTRTVAAANTWYEFDVTSLARAWVSGTRPNNGMLLVGSGAALEMSFWSSEYSVREWWPQLVVRYVQGETVSTPTPTPTLNVTATSGPSPTPTLTPTPGTAMILQQGYNGYTGTDDTHLSSWEPTTAYGRNLTMIVRQGGVRVGLLRFDLAGLPAAATITSARLGLYPVSRSNTGGQTVEVYQMLRPWSEAQANWNVAATGLPWGQPGGNRIGVDRVASPSAARDVAAINVWQEWDVTNLVRTWKANPATNHGVALHGSGATAVEYSFASSEYWWSYDLAPRLVVQYTMP